MDQAMILRLVNQFDDMDKRVSVSTPSCCGCCSCCCCCCVATTITSSAFTAMNLSATAKTNNIPEPKRKLVSIAGGAAIVIGAIIAWLVVMLIDTVEEGVVPYNSEAWYFLAALPFPLLLLLLYKAVNHPHAVGITLKTILLTTIIFAIEFFIGLFIILSSFEASGGIGLGGLLYIVLAMGLSVFGIKKLKERFASVVPQPASTDGPKPVK